MFRKKKHQKEESSERKKILIIDDDKFLLDMYSTKFQEAGYDVEVAFGTIEALEKINKGLSPNIVLLDLVMPEMDGFEFLATVKKEKILKDSKIVVLSNLGQKEDVDKGMALGACDYIVKAYYTPSEIVKKIGKMV